MSSFSSHLIGRRVRTEKLTIGRLTCIYILLSLLSFGIVSAATRYVIWNFSPLAEYDPFTQKILLAKHQKKPIDILFVGPSYVDVGIVPGIFDKEMGSLGYDINAFNLGIGGMGMVELNDVVTSMINSKICCKYVIFLPDFELLFIEEQSNSVRTIKFMNFVHAIDEILYVVNLPKNPEPRFKWKDYIVNIMDAAFRHYTNLGLATGAFGFSALSDQTRNWRSHPTWDRLGYTDLGHEVHGTATFLMTRTDMLKERSDYMSRAISKHQPLSELRVTSAMIDRVVRIAREIEKAGAVPLVLIPPRTGFWDWDADFLAKFTQRCGDSHLLDFAEPTLYPALFDPTVRYDGGHLNGLGAPIWSKLLADKVAQLWGNPRLINSFCRPGR